MGRVCLLVLVLLSSCRSVNTLFGKKSPHEAYAEKLEKAGLFNTVMGSRWKAEAERSLRAPLAVQLPYRQAGYFSPESPESVALAFSAPRGMKLKLELHTRGRPFRLFVELWRAGVQNQPEKRLAFMDSTLQPLEYEVEDENRFIVRLQPELLAGGEYELHIGGGPSLAYPIRAPGRNHIQSFWGADRDGGSRRHEGIDLFAARGTPVVAAADGVVTSVSENRLGGKVVFMRPAGKNYSLYYAHLDQQLVQLGQRVRAGDTLGLMGNTGNAASTAPHLHFGIYTTGGAVDPLPFVNPVPAEAPALRTALPPGAWVRLTSAAPLLQQVGTSSGSIPLQENTPVRVKAVTSTHFLVRTPPGAYGFVSRAALGTSPLADLTLADQPVYEGPDSTGARKHRAFSGKVQVLGKLNGFALVKFGDNTGWIAANRGR